MGQGAAVLVTHAVADEHPGVWNAVKPCTRDTGAAGGCAG